MQIRGSFSKRRVTDFLLEVSFMWNEGYFTEDTYTYGYYRDISPFFQRYCLLLHGYDVRTADETACHCELGFGQGVSVNIHAAAVTGRWTGTDFNPAHAAHANLLCEAAQTGAQFWDCSFAEMLERKDIPLFDSISLHGIWSWISRENQAHVVEFIRRYLKPGGVVYNSYNCFPGWAASHPLRELLLLQDKYIRSDSGSADRVADVLKFADNVLKANPVYAERNKDLANRIERLRIHDAHYIAHEYLNRDWIVMYFTEEAEMMQEAKLDYACTTELLDALDDADDLNFTNETKQFLLSIKHPLVREEIRDYYINRQFRKDLYIKGARKLNPREQVRRILGTKYVLLKTGPDALKCTGYNKSLAIKEEWTKQIVDYLAADNRSPKDFTGFLETHPEIPERILLVFIKAMVRTETFAPCQPDKTVEKAKPYCDRLNHYIYESSLLEEKINYLASPLTGCGVGVNRIQQMFLHLLRKGFDKKGIPGEVQRILSSQGQHLLKDGKPLNEEDGVKELQEQFTKFESETLPLLQVLCIE